MKTIYKLAQAAFTALGHKQPPGKAYQMGFIDGYLAGFREAQKQMEEPRSGAV